MPTILARYGPYFLHTYSVILWLGVGAALGVSAALARRDRRAALDGWLDGALAAAAGALLVGRVVFVWLNAAYFAENPAEAWQIQRGGLGYHGALLGGLAGLWLWARLTRRPFYPYAALLAPGLALLAAFGWAACGVAGCAYGLPAAPGPLAADLPDSLGVYALRYRTQSAGMLGALGVFATALWAYGRARPARLFWGTLAALSLVHAVVALGRGDPAPVLFGLRLDLWVDAGLIVVAVAGSYERRTTRLLSHNDEIEN